MAFPCSLWKKANPLLAPFAPGLQFEEPQSLASQREGTSKRFSQKDMGFDVFRSFVLPGLSRPWPAMAYEASLLALGRP